jgi:hypothetical protein
MMGFGVVQYLLSVPVRVLVRALRKKCGKNQSDDIDMWG